MYPPVRMTKRAVEDRTTWSRSWTGTYPFTRTETEIDDVACHEGNYAVPNVLRGSRTQVKPSPRFAISAQLLHVADLRQVHADEAVFRRPVYVFESRILNHFIRFVRRPCMHRSRVCFIRPGQQDQELGAAGQQLPHVTFRSGLSSSTGCTTTQCNGMNITCSRSSVRGWNLRDGFPSHGSRRLSTTVA